MIISFRKRKREGVCMEENVKQHIVKLENRYNISITAVDDVISFDEEKIVIATNFGIMELLGRDFKINQLNTSNGELLVEGVVDRLEYLNDEEPQAEETGFFGKLFR